MAESVVSLVLETITKLLIEEQNFLSEVSGEAEKLRSDLQMMQAFLRDADKKQHEETRVKVCVSQCRDLAYEAENVLEDFAFKLSSRRRGSGILSTVKRFACILNECIIHHKVGLEIQGINIRISDLTRRFQDYGINALTQGEGSSSGKQQLTYSYVANEDYIVGIGGDIEKLVEVMVKKEDIGVVSITGMGGCGKTTLARKVYNHPNLKAHFDSFAWVCVTQQWKTRNILQEILMSFLPDVREKVQHFREDEIVEKLVRIQQERKCLVVIDDIWAIEAWESINPALLLQKKGNKMLITTRNKDLAKHVDPNGYHHQPRLLTNDEALDLLLKKAFRNKPYQELEDFENLKQLGIEMVKACGGLPLAVIVLGGNLASKQSTSVEWETVSKNVRSYLGRGERIQEDEGKVKRILGLSYDDLPYKLKPCFLYMSILSEDERIDEDRLYNLWLAEGMVSTEDRISRNESIKEVGGRYLGELVKRCIVMVERNQYRNCASCYLHDVMRDVCREKAKEENFLKVLEYVDPELENSISNTPRIMIYSRPENHAAVKYDHIDVCRSLRALMFHVRQSYVKVMAQQVAELKINKFIMLRSLIIESLMDAAVDRIEGGNGKPLLHTDLFKLPIGKLIHLRQLALRYSRLIMSPSSISNLEHLEILDLYQSTIIWTKNDAIKTKQLRELCLPEDVKSGTIRAQTIYVPNDLDILSGQIPNCRLHVKNLSELSNVRELGSIYFDPDHHELEAAEDVIKCVSNSQLLKEVSVGDNYEKLFREERGTILLKELLSSNVPCIRLSASLVHCKLPEWDAHLSASGLTTLILSSSYIKEEDPMKLLEKFPLLQKLELDYVFFGKEMVCHSTGFPNLRYLSLGFMPNFDTWIVEKGAMPNLSHLEIRWCLKLEVIPEELRFISALKELVIKQMYEEFVTRNAVNFGHVNIVTEEIWSKEERFMAGIYKTPYHIFNRQANRA